MTENSAIPMDAEPESEVGAPPPVERASPDAETSIGPDAPPHDVVNKEERRDERLETLNRIARHIHDQDGANHTPPVNRFPPAAGEDGGNPSGGTQGSPALPVIEPVQPSTAGTPATPPSDLVEVTIDGRTEKVPLKQVIKGYQIESAARKRLNEASLLYKKLREQEVALNTSAMPTVPISTTPAASPPTPASGMTHSGQEVQGVVGQSQPTVSTAAAPAPRVDTESLVNIVMARQEVRQEKERLHDIQPHIARDERLRQMHAQMAYDAMLEQPGLSTREYFDQASESINQWLMQLSTARLTRSSGTGQRLMDKREATSKQAPSGVHRKVPSGTDAPPPLSYADKIMQMKKARGLI
ncbi:MAG: hypothetical protein HQL73_08280 [Magnetococcales bacterium]|nr:hypothetical protein [Magnetococcales bacterium]